jgi:hypothetical protein
MAQKVHEVPQRCSITPTRSDVPSAIAQIPDQMVRADAGYLDASLLKPSAKTCSDSDLLLQ